MSGHAETIRTTLGTQGQWNAQAHAALDALLAENERLRQIEDRWLVAAEACSTGDRAALEDALLG